MNVVLIPCYNRPEFLHVCLELIQQAEGCEDNLYLFQVDWGYDPEVLEIIETFPLKKEVNLTPNHNYPNKQSYSVLTGYENCLKHNPAFVFMIEDDLFISNDFFIWHLRNIGVNWGSIATRSHNNKRIRPTNNLASVFIEPEYQSLGVCFKASSVREFLSYVNEEYYTNPAEYIKKTFPKSMIPTIYCEQDGLIRRVIQLKRHKIVFPHVPRAFHAGFYGKSRGERPIGNLEKRVNQVRYTAFDPDIMKGDSKPEMLVNPIL